MSASAGSAASSSSPSPATFLCPISLEIMREPVMAADGYSYERSAIEHWFGTGARSSPMTNDAMASTALTPNRVLRSQISEWQGRSNAQRVAELITAVTTAGVLTSDPKVVEHNLQELTRFVGQSEAVVQPGTLEALSSMLQGFQKLWVAPVQQALRAAEAECKLVVAGLVSRLRDERRDESIVAAAFAVAVGKQAHLDTEIAAAEKALGKLRQKRAKQVQIVKELQRVQRDCATRAAQVEQQLAGYPEPLSLLDEGEQQGKQQGASEGASERQTRSKRKLADEDEEEDEAFQTDSDLMSGIRVRAFLTAEPNQIDGIDYLDADDAQKTVTELPFVTGLQQCDWWVGTSVDPGLELGTCRLTPMRQCNDANGTAETTPGRLRKSRRLAGQLASS